ncbi:hypothetical protein KJ766_02025, partial [Patescibacteria group bacterium]|nr:hypothetical protein [Patescibacteria group bacterium]
METQENQLNGSKKRRSIVLGIGGVVLAILIVLVAVNGGVKKDPYKGLTLIREIQMDDETKQMIEDRITVSQAALKAQQKASSDPRD